MFWGYLHSNGLIIVRVWHGDHKDYTEDVINNPFMLAIVPPFEAPTTEEANRILRSRLVAAPSLT